MPRAHAPENDQAGSMNPQIWRACAGSSFQVPKLNSRVYYFPQGHVEHCSAPPAFLSHHVLSRPLILCHVVAVQFLADPITDEVFARLVLQPIGPEASGAITQLLEPQENSLRRDDDEDGDERVVSFAKVLTPSDANNGGGFSVPRFCADSIFPPLNFQADPPVQNLSITDHHGTVWDFRHIYRGTPRRHLLTTGWSKFVNNKKLVAGDSVVFMKNSRGEMFVGVRRSVRRTGNGDSARWSSQIGGLGIKVEEDSCGLGGRREEFSRSGKGKLSPEAVAEAAEMAAQNLPFEVLYYPRAGWSEFVVKADAVDAALNIRWIGGMRVKMAMETEDSSRMTWLQGTVSSASVPDKGHWQGSPWRMLQVTWDEPEVMQNAERVSPWQVEFLGTTPSMLSSFPPAKKFRALQNSELLTEGDGEIFSPMKGFSSSPMGKFNLSLLNFNSFPAGMQGARQNIYFASNLSNPYNEDASVMYNGNTIANVGMMQNVNIVSTDLNMASSQSDELSPKGHCSVHSFGTDFAGNWSCEAKKRRSYSFQLFGKVIQMKPPEDNAIDDACTEDVRCKVCDETSGPPTRDLLDLYKDS